MRQIPISTASNIMSVIAITGNFLRLEDSMPDTTIEVIEAEKGSQSIVGNKISLKAGDAFRFAGQYTRIGITQSSGVPVIVVITAGLGQLLASRISGNVDANIAPQCLTIAGNQFRGYLITSAPVNFAYLQVWNPVGSGKHIHIKKLSISQALATELRAGTINTQLSGLLNSSNSRINNKLTGGSVTSAIVRAEDGVALIPTSAMSYRTRTNSNTLGDGTQTYSSVLVDRDYDGVVLTEGYGFTIESVQAGAVIQANIDYEELEQ